MGGACPNAACHGVLQRQNGDWERYVCPAGDPAVVMPVGVLGHASATCPVCHKALAHRPGPVAPDLVPQAGKLSLGTPPPRPTKRLGPMRSFEGLSVPAVGVVCGATWLFTSGEPIVWAHEMGHHRHMEHAANAPGAKDDQHDHEDNANIAVGGNTTERQWDLRCMMNGYATADHPGREHDFPCGKCVLKNRGWKVEGLGRPAGNITD